MRQEFESLLRDFVNDCDNPRDRMERVHYAEDFRELEKRHDRSAIVSIFSSVAAASFSAHPVISIPLFMLAAASAVWARVAHGDFEHLSPMLDKYRNSDKNQPTPP